MESSELEHVQYKFATIIGGLCGKPKILSQFAVWLDMRLAEYKLKGAISLGMGRISCNVVLCRVVCFFFFYTPSAIS